MLFVSVSTVKLKQSASYLSIFSMVEEKHEEEDRIWMAEEDGKCAHTEENGEVGPTANKIRS